MSSKNAKVTDPVCGMTFDEDKAAGKREYQGTTFYFCSDSCRKRFDLEPSRYATRTSQGPRRD
ncbi:MAG TPA: YHS domain-containing protein [Thermoanaerobaculia bacterium]|nr:YHS domain-containing protein [Thermoanaerobaculia bacterium]